MRSQPIAGRYDVIRPLGKGSFAHTLLAWDRQLERHVALKVLSERDVSDWKVYELFEREAAVLRTLRHSGIPALYDTFRAPWNDVDASWLSMEYIEGTTLEQCLAESTVLDPITVRRIFMEVLGILDYLHTRVPPVLHRDIKPANIILRTGGGIALVDFGSVRHRVRRPDESGSTVAGTYGYMPYEQYMGQASPASDLYSAAATLLHMVTGRPPGEWMAADGSIQVPETVTCGEPLRSVLVRLLAPSPVERLPSARAAIEAMLAGVDLEAPSMLAHHVASSTSVATRRGVSPPTTITLTRAPRAIEGDTSTLLRKLSYSSWQLMAADRDPSSRPSAVDMAAVAFFSIVTVGVLPLVMWSYARSRRRRLRQFIVDGVPTIARILGMEQEEIGFGVKMTRVRYQFEADGRTHRDVHSVLPSIAARWDTGDSIHIVYLPDRDFDSAIISTS